MLVDHDMSLVSACCDTTAVLDFGRLIASGPTAEVLRDENVIRAYLGTEAGLVSVLAVDSLTVPRRPAGRPWCFAGHPAGPGDGSARAQRCRQVEPGARRRRSVAPGGGKVTLDERRPHRPPAGAHPQAGVAVVPEGRRVLSELTVEDNLRVATYSLAARRCEGWPRLRAHAVP